MPPRFDHSCVASETESERETERKKQRRDLSGREIHRGARQSGVNIPCLLHRRLGGRVVRVGVGSVAGEYRSLCQPFQAAQKLLFGGGIGERVRIPHTRQVAIERGMSGERGARGGECGPARTSTVLFAVRRNPPD